MRTLLVLSILLLLLPCLAIAQTQERMAGKPSQMMLPPPADPGTKVLVTVRVPHRQVAEFKALFKESVLPMAGGSREIRRLETYGAVIGADFTFVMMLELAPRTSVSDFGDLIEIFSRGRHPEEALKMLHRLADFFQETSSSIVQYRPDLSIDRSVAGVANPEGKGGRQ